jgi:hypothetical protein
LGKQIKEKTMNDQKVEVSIGLINGILQYLGNRPFVEVAEVIAAIRDQVTPQIKVPEAAQAPEQIQ